MGPAYVAEVAVPGVTAEEDVADFAGSEGGAGVAVCCVVFGAVWATPETGIESNIRISGEQNRFI
jgi:hypothetical protein